MVKSKAYIIAKFEIDSLTVYIALSCPSIKPIMKKECHNFVIANPEYSRLYYSIDLFNSSSR